MITRRLLIAVLAATVSSACDGAPRSGDNGAEAPVEEGVFGTAPAATGGVPSVVTLTPLTAPTPSGGALDPSPLMDQFGLAFSPRRLVVPLGGTTRFTNSEGSLAHNVRVRFADDGSQLFSGDASPGTTLEVDFMKEGGYDVLCDMHPGMTAFIYVTAAPFHVFADVDGAFLVTGVPEGQYTLDVWNVDAAARSKQSIVVGPGATEIVTGPSR